MSNGSETAGSETIGSVASCWRYPVKSMQGLEVRSVDIGAGGVVGDRSFALVDVASGKLMSAKRYSSLLQARADDEVIRTPDGDETRVDSPDVDRVLSDWLGREVKLTSATGTSGLSYEMTFDPPDDSSEYFDIPVPEGTFLDLAALHIVATATLDGCRAARPDLDWDVRRFRPNLLLDVPGEPFVEDEWVGRELRIGDRMVCAIRQPTVRCAMPLRAQPATTSDDDRRIERPPLERRPELFAAMNELRPELPNHLGVYVDVVTPGRVSVGDPVELLG